MALYPYGIEPYFWEIFFIFILLTALVLFLFNEGMRRLLKLEKRGFFNKAVYVNKRHKVIDRTIRAIFLVFMIIALIVNVTSDSIEMIRIFDPAILLFFMLFLTESTRAVMEYKYSEERNRYLLTASFVLFTSILVISMLMTDFYGVF
ncbi:DUF4181 domain-containing protein [Alkalihalophilus marmarensis]|jgi:hypothetical protein|uniref:DUF4181 domain-containing protein n=1 Tax=Alkalihalophilus marmarensis DSM 21297 TaxID=1188261 RepID=U6SR01_9BACI|nr:DUF4181 domain-containing protein [Alkalihalophilus marmarensis]ERN54038.1 hypothetical protein A33I_08695 [Alkalihalophilus marmarensis DSM 21297]MCM3488141.1 DUF4181 domain-containing protein [Alkalihalophilus marmarensis]